MIRGYLAQQADVPRTVPLFVGASRIPFDSKYRVERLLYRGLEEARAQVTRKTIRAEIQGGELLHERSRARISRPVFQPIFDLATGEMIGIEALSRGPRGSELESGESLFSLAERTELLLPLERVCRAIALQAAAAGAPTARSS